MIRDTITFDFIERSNPTHLLKYKYVLDCNEYLLLVTKDTLSNRVTFKISSVLQKYELRMFLNELYKKCFTVFSSLIYFSHSQSDFNLTTLNLKLNCYVKDDDQLNLMLKEITNLIKEIKPNISALNIPIKVAYVTKSELF